MPFTPIAQLINKKYKNNKLSKNITAALVCEEFDKLLVELIGEKIKNNAQAMYLKNKVLNVTCLSPVVAQEIKMREGELISGLEDKFGEGVVERLRLLT